MAMAQSESFFDYVKKELECSVCQEIFTKVNVPKVLKCQHTFCKSCLERWLRQQRSGALSCPNCREITDCPNNDINSLPSNLTYKKLQDILEDFSEAKENVCERHKEKVKFYCEQCESCICSECVVIEHRDKDYHNILSLEAGVRKQKAKLECKMSEAKASRSQLVSYIATLEKQLTKIDNSIDHATDEVHRVSKHWINLIRQHEISATEQLITQKSSLNDRFSKKLSKSNEKLLEIDKLLELSDKILQENDLTEILNVKELLERRLQELSMDSKLTPMLNYLEIQYIPNDTLSLNRAPGKLATTCTEPSLSVAKGEGLTKGLEGEEGTFTVITNDLEGKTTYSEIDNVFVEIKTNQTGIEDIHPVIKDSKDGRYSIAYIIGVPGEFNVSIKVREEPIKGSPFKLTVLKKTANTTVKTVSVEAKAQTNVDRSEMGGAAAASPTDVIKATLIDENPEANALPTNSVEVDMAKRSAHPTITEIQTFKLDPLAIRFISQFFNEHIHNITEKCLVEFFTSNGGTQITLQPKQDCDLTRYKEACSEIFSLLDSATQGMVTWEMDLKGADEGSVDALIQYIATKYPVVIDRPQEHGPFVVYGDAALVRQVKRTVQGGMSEQASYDTPSW
ncbi:hypothetical protein ACROYT_G011272 [Oculina patagonica]